jgi:hypothetical protein
MAGFLAGLSLALAGVGTGLQVASQLRAGRAERQAAEAQRRAAESAAALLDYNAAVAELQAQDALERGAEAEARFRERIRLTIGAQRAGVAAQQIDVGYGSAVDVQADAALLGELDALQIRQNAAREAWGYRVQAFDLRARGRITRQEGIMASLAGREAQAQARLAAMGTVIGTGVSLLEQRYGLPTTRRRGGG